MILFRIELVNKIYYFVDIKRLPKILISFVDILSYAFCTGIILYTIFVREFKTLIILYVPVFFQVSDYVPGDILII